MTPRSVRLVDTSTRDGNQSLWGATGLTTGMVEALGPHLEAAGFAALDFTSSTHLSVGVRWHEEDPWERISRMRAVVPTTPLSFITTGMRFMSWDRSPESVLRLSTRLLAESGLRRMQIAEPMNDTAQASAIARMAKEEGIEQVAAAVTFTESPVHDDALYARAAKVLAADENVDVVYLKDPGGLLTPERTRALVPQLRAAVGDLTFELHGHCTTGLAPQVYVLAAQLGVDVLHTAIGALSNGTSQPSALRLVENLAAVGISTDIDAGPLREAERIIAEIARTQGLEPGRPTELDLAYQRHQVPGGMMGTLRRQLAEIGRPDLLSAVLDEVAVVREELGWPIMVTPYSQFVGSQAVLNVLAVRSGEARWSRMPDEVLRYLLGHFGTPPGDVDPEVADRASGHPRTRELDRPLPEPSQADLRADVAAQVGRPVVDGEVLLRTVLPAGQVDAIRPAPRWTPSPEGRSVVPGEQVDAVRPVSGQAAGSVVRAVGDQVDAVGSASAQEPGPEVRTAAEQADSTRPAPRQTHSPEVRTAADFVRAACALPGWRELDVQVGAERVRLRRNQDGGRA
ncbi:biotin carboxyl carrier protein [Lentzea sp. NPDC058436]|uniref:biotin carboxyl carrier protein n=1 Tax=Lentzea sp. NPDC058436 TaxID=3346499 RepID=UPI0036536755